MAVSVCRKIIDPTSDGQVGLPLSQVVFYAAEMVNALVYLRSQQIVPTLLTLTTLLKDFGMTGICHMLCEYFLMKVS